MKAVIQRVKKAVLFSEGEKHSEIGFGLLVLLGVCKEDTIQKVPKFVERLLKFRIFDDENGKTNLNIFDAKGEILVVSNFTLYGNLNDSNRPSFVDAAGRAEAEPIYDEVCRLLGEKVSTKTGVFHTQMDIEMIADGPNTYVFEM